MSDGTFHRGSGGCWNGPAWPRPSCQHLTSSCVKRGGALRHEAWQEFQCDPAPGLGSPGMNGAKGKTEAGLGERQSAPLAAEGFGRAKHFPLGAWLGKGREAKQASVDVGSFAVWSKIRTKSGNESHVQWPKSETF